MKRLFAALVALLLAPACLAVGPYLAGSSMPAGDLPALMGRVEQKLRDDGFAVVGRHLPPGLPQHGSVIVTDPALNQADGIHPNAEGARRVATTVWQELGPLLGE